MVLVDPFPREVLVKQLRSFVFNYLTTSTNGYVRGFRNIIYFVHYAKRIHQIVNRRVPMLRRHGKRIYRDGLSKRFLPKWVYNDDFTKINFVAIGENIIDRFPILRSVQKTQTASPSITRVYTSQ